MSWKAMEEDSKGPCLGERWNLMCVFEGMCWGKKKDDSVFKVVMISLKSQVNITKLFYMAIRSKEDIAIRSLTENRR